MGAVGVDIVFFGTNNIEAGHYLWMPGGSPARGCGAVDRHHTLGDLDGRFLKNMYGREFVGEYTFTRGYTVLAWVDYTGDSRPGSNACLVVKGERTPREVLALGSEYYPWAANRFANVAKEVE